jgi:hypothetical protein
MRLFWCLLLVIPNVFAQSQYTTRIKNSDFNISNDVVNIVEYEYDNEDDESKKSKIKVETIKEWKFSKGYLFQETIAKDLNTKSISLYVYLPDRSLYSISLRETFKYVKSEDTVFKYKRFKFKGLDFYMPENAQVLQQEEDVLDVNYLLNKKNYGEKLSVKDGLIEKYNTSPYGLSIYKYNNKGVIIDAFFPGVSGKKYEYGNRGELIKKSTYGSPFNKTVTLIYYEYDVFNNWIKKTEVDIDNNGLKGSRFFSRVLTYENGKSTGDSNYDLSFVNNSTLKALKQASQKSNVTQTAPATFKGKYYYKKTIGDEFWIYNDKNESVANKCVHLDFINSDFYMYEPATKKVLKLVNYSNGDIDKAYPVEVVMNGEENVLHVNKNGDVVFYCEGKLTTVKESKLITINGKKFVMVPNGSKNTYWFLYEKTKPGVYKINKLPYSEDNAYWGKMFVGDGSLKTDLFIVVNGEQPAIKNFKLLKPDGSFLFSISDKYYRVPFRASKLMKLQPLVPIAKAEFDQLTTGVNTSTSNNNISKTLTSEALEISKCKNGQDVESCVANLFKKKHKDLKALGKAEAEIYKDLAMFIRETGKQFTPKVQCRVLMDSDIPNDKMREILSCLTKEERAKISSEAQKIVDEYNKNFGKKNN